MNASGLPDASLTIADADVDDEEEVLEALITNNTHLKDLTALWRQLIDKTQHEVLFDGVLFPWVIEWMCAMSQSRHRGAGMALMVRMTELAVELATQATAKQRQASKPGKKGGAGMAAILKEEVQKLQENETALEEMVTAAFTGLFVERYRDRAEEVRASCLSALGRVMQLHPSMFLADTYLKYLGWSLSDMAAAVRAASLSQLSAVYTAHGAAEEICRVDGKPVSGAERLLNFTRRFESRFIEMTRDVDIKAQAVSEVVRVMRNNEPSQLKALVPLLASYAWDTAGGEAEKMPEVCLKMALAMSDKQPLLLDWTGYTDLLLGEALDDAAEHLQGALLYLMSAGAVFVNSIKEPATPRKKRALADQDERALALSAELGRSLTELLEKYGAQREALPALLGLVGQLRLRGAQAALKGPAFGSLLEQLEASACFFKHNDATSIALCAGAWSELMQQPGERPPSGSTQARARFRKLSSKLVAALKPLDAHTKKKPTAPFAFDEAAIAMSRLARLVTVQPQAAAAALKPIDGLGERLVAAVEARKEQRAPADGGLVACTTLLLQLETTVLCAAFSEVYDEPSEAVLEKRDDLLLLLGRALHAPSAAVARLAAALLAWLLQSTCSIEKGSGASEEAEEAEGGTPQESREALLTDVVKSGLAGGVSFAAAVRLLLVHLDHLPRDYKEFAKELWGHIAKVRPHELSDRQLGVLTLSFEEDEPAVFEAVAKQATIEAGAAWALEPGHARDRARFVEGGLAPLLALCTAKGAALIARGELSDRFGGKSATLYPRWNRELRKGQGVFEREEGAGSWEGETPCTFACLGPQPFVMASGIASNHVHYATNPTIAAETLRQREEGLAVPFVMLDSQALAVSRLLPNLPPCRACAMRCCQRASAVATDWQACCV
ncbi:hypothetical protein EMIHUDRAFT_198903 [Emiliania huxleyi CCMP1516]|uniref:SCD domain-containing protein n=2 Tax=Emiliania huxleyi TaxID=2903 RepID=A0A0D3I1Z1_EMIH1|nr:hypothetical protein EMIHUDRAFT_198903 [Emiliania huxleyi CCMP1516]EOD05276.1 hypothetical protein EMIHUDRAFT_198903 [Emiliania huxleyi CCMP1516]|eukprot:XP_005757705.1 hypothetical protein EMIHUDRAFT_198903 [Emiliania huxleyi CCMP1516]